jgi:hypothetical protein
MRQDVVDIEKVKPNGEITGIKRAERKAEDVRIYSFAMRRHFVLDASIYGQLIVAKGAPGFRANLQLDLPKSACDQLWEYVIVVNGTVS